MRVKQPQKKYESHIGVNRIDIQNSGISIGGTFGKDDPGEDAAVVTSPLASAYDIALTHYSVFPSICSICSRFSVSYFSKAAIILFS